ncbi:Branchpoint-bridging protein [Verticillium dahliae VDG1]|nr:Branchpoint-bridging protein [Verticillium dahliae VDG1]
MASQPKPRVRRTPQNTQYTYNLAKRIHDVKTYPVLSPQGATILLYAHGNGITIAWRGGRRFKAPQKATPPASKPNGNATPFADVVMLVDSDEEDAPPPKKQTVVPYVDKPEFEDAAEDEPYPDIIQTLDLSLGAPALQIAVLPITPCTAEEAAGAGAETLKDTMVFAVSCSNADVYTKHSHGIALSLAKPPKSSSTSDRIREQAGASLAAPRSRLVVASHNKEASGVLRLWDVPLDIKTEGGDKSRVRPFQTEYLPTPLIGISFNPTNTSQLLVVAGSQAARIYDYAAASLPPDDQSIGPFPTKGSWLLSLYQPFARPTATRKPILDAAWISHGRAVFALLADGSWGIWDIEGASPLGSTLLGKQSSGIQGAALTAFSVSGQIEGTSPLRNAVNGARSSGDFVPLTPHSRRDAAASLNAVATPEKLASIKGGVTVIPLPTRGSQSGDESVVVWIGGHDNVSIIPAVSRFWDAQLRRRSGGGVNLFSGTTPTRMVRLQDLATGLLGERCCGVSAAVDFEKLHENDGGLRIEVLIQGESRLVIVRESEEGVGTKVGGIVSTSRRLFGDRGKAEPADAIIVHPRPNQSRNVSFSLNIGKKRSIRGPPPNVREGSAAFEDEPTHDFTLPMGRPRSGFGFNLDAAADVEEDVERDVEAEMLDIMEIDRALDSLDDDRGSGRKKVFFEDQFT